MEVIKKQSLIKSTKEFPKNQTFIYLGIRLCRNQYNIFREIKLEGFMKGVLQSMLLKVDNTFKSLVRMALTRFSVV